jgi:pyruvate/2-oxoglutarate dehydrogenase complex dihydrolipoamide dehydrogenase (E3) component
MRVLLRKQHNATVLLGDVSRIDLSRRLVTADEGRLDIPFDYLIVATGSRHSYFGHPEWEVLAPGLKTVEDAVEMRRRFLLAFEEAERAATVEERDAWLTFVIVGAGPTGCELAGVMQEIAHGMRHDFHRVDTRDTAVILLEAGPRVLPAYPENLSARAEQVEDSLGLVADFWRTSGETGQKKKLAGEIDARREAGTEYIEITQWQCVIEYTSGGECVRGARIRNHCHTVGSWNRTHLERRLGYDSKSTE